MNFIQVTGKILNICLIFWFNCMNFFKKIDYLNTSSSIICNNKTYSYKDLFHDINHFKFIAKKKSLVFILSENNYECIAAYSGVSYFDSVVMLLDGSINQETSTNIVASRLSHRKSITKQAPLNRRASRLSNRTSLWNMLPWNGELPDTHIEHRLRIMLPWC